jgi:hypothetical protein
MAKAGKQVSLVKLAGKIKQPPVQTLAYHDMDDADRPGKKFTPVQPTLERLVQAGIAPTSNIKSRVLQVVVNNQVGSDGITRMSQAPLQWLASRGMLDDDKERNRILKEAGERYYRHWFDGGLGGFPTSDLNRISSSRENMAGLLRATEYAMQHREEYHAARERMGGWLAKVADAVICDEMRLADAGSAFGDYASSSTRAAIAGTMLKAALTTLAEHFGMISRAR